MSQPVYFALKSPIVVLGSEVDLGLSMMTLIKMDIARIWLFLAELVESLTIIPGLNRPEVTSNEQRHLGFPGLRDMHVACQF